MEFPALLVIAAALLGGLLYAEKTGRSKLVLAFKTPLSVLFVIVALFVPHPAQTYYLLILVGLILGLVGDVCLALPGNRTFMAGLAAFLLGHIFYIIAFAYLVNPSEWLSPAGLIVIVIGIIIFVWLRPHVGSMLIPVVAYTIVISIMLVGAWAVLNNPLIAKAGARGVFAGALFFYISDVFVARDRFVKSEFLNRLLGLPLYYAGQFLLAFSVMLVK
jgi:uncharacterized membrane protein YhhN